MFTLRLHEISPLIGYRPFGQMVICGRNWDPDKERLVGKGRVIWPIFPMGRMVTTTPSGGICPLAPVNDGRKTQDPAALLGAQCPNRVDGCGAQSWQQAGDNRDEGKHCCNGGEPDWIEGGDSVEHLFDEPCRDYQSNCARHKSSRQQDER